MKYGTAERVICKLNSAEFWENFALALLFFFFLNFSGLYAGQIMNLGTVVWHKHWRPWQIFFAWNKMFVKFIVAKPQDIFDWD